MDRGNRGRYVLSLVSYHSFRGETIAKCSSQDEVAVLHKLLNALVDLGLLSKLGSSNSECAAGGVDHIPILGSYKTIEGAGKLIVGFDEVLDETIVDRKASRGKVNSVGIAIDESFVFCQSMWNINGSGCRSYSAHS